MRVFTKNSPLFTWIPLGFAFFLAVLGIFARLFWLRYIPFSYYHDEMDYVFTGEAVARFGTNISGEWSPWKLVPELTTNVTAELPALFQGITQKMFGIGAQSGHYTSAVFGLLTAALVGYIAWSVWNSKRAAFWSTIAVLITPWSIHLSRMAYEAPISLFFQLLLVLSLINILIKPHKQVKKVLVWSAIGLVATFFAYYTYHAAKLIVPCILAGSFVYALFIKRTRWTLTPIVVLGLVAGALLLRTQIQNTQGLLGTRSSELISSPAYLTPFIDEERLNSLELPGSSLVINKGTIFVHEAIKRYVGVFDVYRLGVEGSESGFQFSLAVSGFFSISIMAMMAYGLVRGLHVQDEGIKYLLFIMLISPVASVANTGYQSIFRSALVYIMLLIFAGYGITKLSYERGIKTRVLLIGILCCACVELGVFTHQYFNRYGVISAENHYFGKKVLAGYVSRVPKDRSVVIIGEQAYMAARAIVSYGGLMPTLSMEERTQLGTPNGKSYTLGNVRLSEACDVLDLDAPTTYVIEGPMLRGCGYDKDLATFAATQSGRVKQTSVALPALSSQVGSGTYYNLINDNVCDVAQLPHFVRARTIQSFDTVALSDQAYCTTWVKLEPVSF